LSGALGLFSSAACASTLFSIQPSAALAEPGYSGEFDVVLTNSGPAGIVVQSFSFQVSVTGPGITLTGAGFSTSSLGYIFAGDSFDVNNGFTLNLDLPGQTMDGTDGTDSGAGISLASGESLALGAVLFDVSPTAALGAF
jgi:hypothetical protein